MSKAKMLSDLLKAKEILVMPGAYDCLSAKMVELAEFKAVQMSGYGFSASLLGKPDIGLLGFDEVLRHTHNICNAVNIPVMADGDTGYGNSLNVIRTVQEFEQAGAAGINLEDQVWPKRCGHMDGKEVISAEEMAKKIEAAVCGPSSVFMCADSRASCPAHDRHNEMVLHACRGAQWPVVGPLASAAWPWQHGDMQSSC